MGHKGIVVRHLSGSRVGGIGSVSLRLLLALALLLHPQCVARIRVGVVHLLGFPIGILRDNLLLRCLLFSLLALAFTLFPLAFTILLHVLSLSLLQPLYQLKDLRYLIIDLLLESLVPLIDVEYRGGYACHLLLDFLCLLDKDLAECVFVELISLECISDDRYSFFDVVDLGGELEYSPPSEVAFLGLVFAYELVECLKLCLKHSGDMLSNILNPLVKLGNEFALEMGVHAVLDDAFNDGVYFSVEFVLYVAVLLHFYAGGTDLA